MIINTNMASLNTLRQLGVNEKSTQSSLAKLSSGLRINSAADDAAGLAISEKMRGQISGLNKASSNAQDGISMVSTAEGSLNETTSILQRMRELAVQGSNDTNTTSDRTAIQTEMNQLTSEINRIGNTTEFNTQKLLKGSDKPVVVNAATATTLTAGVAGVPQGNLNNYKLNANSILASSSSTTVQASSATTTGAATIITENTASTKGVASSVTLTNGMQFVSDVSAASLGTLTTNNVRVEIKQATGNSVASTFDVSGETYTFTVGTDATGNSLVSTRGELYNVLNNLITAGPTSGWGANEKFKVIPPESTSTDAEVTSVVANGNFAGGINEVVGDYAFNITDAFTESGDSITIGGKTFTGVIGTPDPAKRQFAIAADAVTPPTAAAQAASLVAALNADSDIGGRFTVTNPAGATLQFVEKAGQATGVALEKPTVSGAGANDTLTITDAKGQNLNTVTIVQSTTTAATVAISSAFTAMSLAAGLVGSELNGVTIKFSGTTTGTVDATTKATWDINTSTLTVTGRLKNSTDLLSVIKSGLSRAGFNNNDVTAISLHGTVANAAGATLDGLSTTFGVGTGSKAGRIATLADEMAVSADGKGNLTVYLADKTASKNTAANIQDAIQALSKNETYKDFSALTAVAGGDWDTNTLGNSLTKDIATMVGGVREVKGDYSFEVGTAFKAGDIAVVAGQKFKAVASGADAAKGEFNVSSGDVNSQAAGLADAISLNAVTSKYNAIVDGYKITLVEKEASGSDLKASDLVVKATGTAGQYSIDTGAINGNGGTFSFDGTVIKVSNKTANVGYANGTAIKEAADTATQTQELVDAINTNATLSEKYTASVGTDGNLLLTQQEGEETATAPTAVVTTAPHGDFVAKMQIGANTGQTMTVEVSDMRAVALGVSGDGSESTVEAQNGAVASYVAVANVSNGSDNNNIEFSLDISTADKATAAISIIDDATAAVSAERSKLGAYQNRLEHTINNLGTSSQNITTAEANIRDVDMAKEMTNFQKNNILQQAAQAMLAQANQQGQGVLQLLR